MFCDYKVKVNFMIFFMQRRKLLDVIEFLRISNLNVLGKGEIIPAEPMQNDMRITMHMVIPARIEDQEGL
ncbi:hypothetical protein [Anaerocolumna sp.]|uniref:hypothetical protein n=1 Tax=Anaerocolumna sp. TaxID=2041569 RepID=UPI0028B14C6D|nr:hypothetical protein [Anaerocolumna sp.]